MTPHSADLGDRPRVACCGAIEGADHAQACPARCPECRVLPAEPGGHHGLRRGFDLCSRHRCPHADADVHVCWDCR